MISETFDYATPEKLLLNQIQEELAARTPEQIEKDKTDSERSLAILMEKHEQFIRTNKKVGDLLKIKNFLHFAEILRKFTAEHTGWMQTTIDEGWHGMIKMRFEMLFFLENDASDSHKIFASIFERFKDIHLGTEEGHLTVEIFEHLYDMIPIAKVNKGQEQS